MHRLPSDIVKDGFFIHWTGCLTAYRGLKWDKVGDEEDPSQPLSFKTDSELLPAPINCTAAAPYWPRASQRHRAIRGQHGANPRLLQ